jgi:putative (di)nucleoside polyphosphate hydrolase
VTRVHANDAAPEFGEWRWEKLERVPALVVSFRRLVYARVAEEFARFT